MNFSGEVVIKNFVVYALDGVRIKIFLETLIIDKSSLSDYRWIIYDFFQDRLKTFYFESVTVLILVQTRLFFI